MRALRDLLARYRDPDLATIQNSQAQQPVFQNLIILVIVGQRSGLLEPPRILFPAFICLDFPNMAISWVRMALQLYASVWHRVGLVSRYSHESTDLAPQHY